MRVIALFFMLSILANAFLGLFYGIKWIIEWGKVPMYHRFPDIIDDRYRGQP